MIFAVVLIVTAGLAMGIGYIWGSENAATNIFNDLKAQDDGNVYTRGAHRLNVRR